VGVLALLRLRELAGAQHTAGSAQQPMA
jgi:hypothetical protein